MGRGSGGAGVDRRAAEHTAQTIHQRLIATIAGQRPDYTGERTERIRTIFVLRAVRHLARDHGPAQRSLSTVVGRLYAWIIQKPQQVATTVIVPTKLVLKPPVVTIRHRAVSEMIALNIAQICPLSSIIAHMPDGPGGSPRH